MDRSIVINNEAKKYKYLMINLVREFGYNTVVTIVRWKDVEEATMCNRGSYNIGEKKNYKILYSRDISHWIFPILRPSFLTANH